MGAWLEGLAFVALALLTISQTDYSNGENHTPHGLAWKIVPVVWLAVAAQWRLRGSLRALHSAALAFSALGDLLIGAMYISHTCFALSMVSFALGHGCYVASFWAGRRRLRWPLLAPMAAFALWCMWETHSALGQEPWPIVVLLRGYSAVLLWTTFAALSHFASGGQKSSDGTRSAGLLLFCLSDSLILLGNFSDHHLPQPQTQIVVISTYYVAVLLIYVSSVLRQALC